MTIVSEYSPRVSVFAGVGRAAMAESDLVEALRMTSASISLGLFDLDDAGSLDALIAALGASEIWTTDEIRLAFVTDDQVDLDAVHPFASGTWRHCTCRPVAGSSYMTSRQIHFFTESRSLLFYLLFPWKLAMILHQGNFRRWYKLPQEAFLS